MIRQPTPVTESNRRMSQNHPPSQLQQPPVQLQQGSNSRGVVVDDSRENRRLSVNKNIKQNQSIQQQNQQQVQQKQQQQQQVKKVAHVTVAKEKTRTRLLIDDDFDHLHSPYELISPANSIYDGIEDDQFNDTQMIKVMNDIRR